MEREFTKNITEFHRPSEYERCKRLGYSSGAPPPTRTCTTLHLTAGPPSTSKQFTQRSDQQCGIR